MIDWAWTILSLGIAYLVLAGLQIHSGKTFFGCGWGGRPPWITRKKYPIEFWLMAGGCIVVGLFEIGVAVTFLM